MTYSQSDGASPASLAPAWDEAFLRVEGYLRAHGLEGRVVLSQITTEIIREAQSRALATPGEEPIARAMEATHARIGAWFAGAGHPVDWTNERMRAQGRLTLIIADLPGRWANYFLSSDPVPAELAAALASMAILPGPELRFSNMTAEPLQFGFEPADPGLPNRRLWLPARALISWLLIVGFFSVAWAASH